MSPEAQTKTYHIVVNGQKKEVGTNVLSYDAVVNLGFDNNPPKGENVVITVTFSKAEHDKQGTLVAGQSVVIKNGTIFNVKATDRS